MKQIPLLLFTLTLLAPEQGFADDKCLDCGRRKMNMCSEECALVPSERVPECQYLCISQYCEHKCTNSDGSSKIGELKKLFSKKCEECKEEQFLLCEKSCLPGSPFQVALCRIKCAAGRCDRHCEKD